MQGSDPHYRFLAACLSGKRGEAQCYRHSASWNWEKLVEIAADQSVLSAVYDCLRAIDLLSELPADVAEVFQVTKALNEDRNHRILIQLRAAASALNRAGIEPVVLKGLAQLLSGVYSNSGTRYLIDIDLLVPDTRFAESVQIIAGLGYAHAEVHPIELTVGHSHPPLGRPQSEEPDAIEIDLHRHMGTGICQTLLPAAEVLGDSTLYTLDSARLRIPSPEHLLVHHVMHSQMHDSYRDRIWPSLRTMYDLVLLDRRFGRGLDWRAVQARFKSHKQSAVLAMYLLRVQEVFGHEPPLSLNLDVLTRLRWWRRRMLWESPALRFKDPFWFLFAGLTWRTRRVRAIARTPGGLRYLLRTLFSTGFYARLKADLE